MISNEDRVFHALVRLGGVANGRQLAEALDMKDPNATRQIGQLMRHLVPGRVERLADGVYKIRGQIR